MGEVDAAERLAAEARAARRVDIIARLVREGAQRDQATLYADLFLEYEEASANIARHGVIVQHPRTLNPIDNPYLARRDRARRELQRMRWIHAAWLWETA